MHVNSTLVEMRLDRFVSERLMPALYRRAVPLTLARWEAPGEPVPFTQTRQQEFEPFAVGQEWGRPWATTWFHVTGEVPADWADGGLTAELVFDLGFTHAQPGFQAEATVYRSNGSVLKGLHPRNRYVPLEGLERPLDLYLEAASNPDVAGEFTFRPTPYGDKATAGDRPLYRFMAAHLAERDTTVWELVQDVWTLLGLMRSIPADLPRRAMILRAIEDMMDTVDPHDVAGTADS